MKREKTLHRNSALAMNFVAKLTNDAAALRLHEFAVRGTDVQTRELARHFARRASDGFWAASVDSTLLVVAAQVPCLRSS